MSFEKQVQDIFLFPKLCRIAILKNGDFVQLKHDMGQVETETCEKGSELVMTRRGAMLDEYLQHNARAQCAQRESFLLESYLQAFEFGPMPYPGHSPHLLLPISRT
jgi:hypothetical protein